MAFEINAKFFVQVAFWYYVATIVVGAIIGAWFLFSQSDEEAKEGPKKEEWGRFKREVLKMGEADEGASSQEANAEKESKAEGGEGDADRSKENPTKGDDPVEAEKRGATDAVKQETEAAGKTAGGAKEGGKQQKGISVEEVSRHSSRDDCWLIIKGKVYDVTSYVDEHPGGDTITRKAGGEATEGFYGPQHPSRVFDQIEDFLVGDLATE